MELECAGYATFIQIIQITAAATCFIYWKMLEEEGGGGIPRSQILFNPDSFLEGKAL